MSEFEYVVGDSFDAGPAEIQKYIQAILAVGGTFSYQGNIVTILTLPFEPSQPKAEVSLEATPDPAPPKAEVPLDVSPTDSPDVFIEAILEVPEEAPSISHEQTVYEKNLDFPVPVIEETTAWENEGGSPVVAPPKPSRKARTSKTATAIEGG